MAFIDDLEARLKQSTQNIGNDINSYIQNRLTDAVVKIGEPPKGNLTAQQIAQGQTGQGQAIAAPASQAVSSGFNYNKLLIPAAILAVGFFLLNKKSRG